MAFCRGCRRTPIVLGQDGLATQTGALDGGLLILFFIARVGEVNLFLILFLFRLALLLTLFVALSVTVTVAVRSVGSIARPHRIARWRRWWQPSLIVRASWRRA